MIIILILLLFCPSCAYALNDHDCINAIIGEAESEPFEGQVAIGNAIRHRNSLKGVYGIHSKRVLNHLYSDKTYKQACKAWETSKKVDLSSHAQGWGNSRDLVHFKSTKWFKKCIITAHIGQHFFWRVKNV